MIQQQPISRINARLRLEMSQDGLPTRIMIWDHLLVGSDIVYHSRLDRSRDTEIVIGTTEEVDESILSSYLQRIPPGRQFLDFNIFALLESDENGTNSLEIRPDSMSTGFVCEIIQKHPAHLWEPEQGWTEVVKPGVKWCDGRDVAKGEWRD